MKSCPVNAAAACDEGETGVRWSITLKSWIFVFANYQWAIEECPSAPLENQLLQKTCPAFLPLQDCLLFWHLLCVMGRGKKLSKSSLWLFLPEPMCQSAPQQLAALPRGCTTAGSCWSMTDWLPPLPGPKCQRGLALLSELAPGNLLHGSKVEHSGARDPEPGQSSILW